MDEVDSKPIGEAQPIDPRCGLRILRRIGAIAGITIGGVAAFAFFLAPTRLSGASRSARLIWQNRQKEISETLRREDAARLESEQSAHKKDQPGTQR
jgi:hypothetical protein